LMALWLGPPDTVTLKTLLAGVTVPEPLSEDSMPSLLPPQEAMPTQSAMPKQPRSATRIYALTRDLPP
jgi:hypothetical protein